MSEAEFVVLGNEPTAVDIAGTEVTMLKPAGRRGMRRHVLVDVNEAGRRRRLPLLLLVAAVLGAAAVVFVVRKRRASAHGAEEPTDIVDEDLGLFERGEMSAL